MREEHIETPRTARYYVLGTAGPATREVWIVCHGFGQLAARFMKRFLPFEDAARVIVAPEALNRYYLDTSPRPHGAGDPVGATWMTREDREYEIRDYVRYLDSVCGAVLAPISRNNVRIRVLGFSQGVATVCRWISFGVTRPDSAVLWAATIPPDLDLQGVAERWRTADTYVVWGHEEFAAHTAAVERDLARLLAAGIPHQLLKFHGGHELDTPTLRLIADSW